MPTQRIVIVKLTSLGDIIHTIPMAAAIREHRPDARVAWIVEEHEEILLRGNPVVDEIVIAPLRRWRRSVWEGRLASVVREVRDFRARLRALGADVAIDVQGWTHKTSPIVALTRAPMRIGFSRTHARRPWSTRFTTHHVTPPPEAAHVVDQNLRLLQPLGIDATIARFVLPHWPDAERRVVEWMDAEGIAAGSAVVLLPSTRRRSKFWPATSYAALARQLAAATGRPIVLVGGPGERALMDEVLAHAGVASIRSYTPEPITDVARFLARVGLVVGNDTGPLHLSAIAGVPTIGLFGPTRGARNGPYGPTGRYIQSPTRRMSDIPVEKVFNAAMRALDR